MRHDWEYSNPENADCVLTGCDRTTSWMLVWWYHHYIEHNTLPIVFADFGMHIQERTWCQTKGEVIRIDGQFPCNWFKKPTAILKCNYKRIIWIDTDCEIRDNITPIFDYLNDGPGIAGATDPYTMTGSRHTINTGVLAVRHGNELVQQWAERCGLDSAKLRGDQEVLGTLLDDNYTNIAIIPPKYNHLRLAGSENANDAAIMHWTGQPGKNHIRRIIAPNSPPLVRPAAPPPRLHNIKPNNQQKPHTILKPRQPTLIRLKPTIIPLTALQQQGIRRKAT